MADALKIQRLDNSGTPLVDYLFDEKEVINTTPVRKQRIRVDRNQAGKPTLVQLSAPKTEVVVQFRIHSEQTIAKLTTLRNLAKQEVRVRIFPGWQEDPTKSYDCVMPVDIQIYPFTIGQYRGGEVVEVIFREQEL